MCCKWLLLLTIETNWCKLLNDIWCKWMSIMYNDVSHDISKQASKHYAKSYKLIPSCWHIADWHCGCLNTLTHAYVALMIAPEHVQLLLISKETSRCRCIRLISIEFISAKHVHNRVGTSVLQDSTYSECTMCWTYFSYILLAAWQ